MIEKKGRRYAPPLRAGACFGPLGHFALSPWTAPLRAGRRTTWCWVGDPARGGFYFVTSCTHQRRTGLTTGTIGTAIVAELTAVVGAEELLIGTVMPDHVHALFRLGDRLTLSNTVGQFKLRTDAAFASSCSELAWQRNFFDRRVRTHESLESYALYIFLNPYRAGLIPLNEPWPWTIVGTAVRFRFVETFETEGAVRAEWLGACEQWEKSLGFTLGDR